MSFTTFPSLITPTSQIISASALSPINTYQTTIPVVNTVSSISGLGTYGTYVPLYPSVVSYPNVNSNNNLQSKVTEYFFDKILKNWLRFHYLELYQLIKISNNKAELISKLSDLNVTKSESENGLKYEFIVDNYLTMNDVRDLLTKFVKLNNINWWDLKKHSEKIRKFIQHKVTKYIKRQISESETKSKSE